MNYRVLGRTGIQVSEVAMGSEGYVNSDETRSLALIDQALNCGINYFDMYNSEPYVRSVLGKAMRNRRNQFVIQGHLGSTWVDGQYKRSRDLTMVKGAYEDLFLRLETDYIDIGMIHYVDEQEDYEEVFGGPFLEYVKELKAEGRIHFIGLSTHNQRIALQAAETGMIDVIMLSINPAYDMASSESIDAVFDGSAFQNNALSNIDPFRSDLYHYCEAHGVALTAMKPFAGGLLLQEQASPFGVALTVSQCLHYCLTRPAVTTAIVGARTTQQIDEATRYSELPEEDKDYATILGNAPAHRFSDKCMYCGHCAPCTVGIDIASINKYADLCEAQGMVPETVRDHYELLKVKASACIACGVCESNCPFEVKIIEHMEKAAKIFGK